ncbi:MAG: macro domain-containing protein, partial [Nitrospinota bacterium]
MRERRIGRGLIRLSAGDITESATDAIVNAANNHLWMGAGVAGAIKRKGGDAIEREAVAKGPIPVGEAVATGGGALKARHVIHAAGMGQDLRTSGDLVEACTRASLRRAEELRLQSIAFPAIGTGVGGLPAAAAAERMLRAAAQHLAGGAGSLERIEFVLFTEADLR